MSLHLVMYCNSLQDVGYPAWKRHAVSEVVGTLGRYSERNAEGTYKYSRYDVTLHSLMEAECQANA